MQRKRYQFWLQHGKSGDFVYRSCLVADVKQLVRTLKHWGYRVLSVKPM